ncbi:MAG: exonuclease domain-containing protein [Saprospiraceae bacterium]|nr:exonuclease domain-containing protein [Saprospiraceae bacterium]
MHFIIYDIEATCWSSPREMERKTREVIEIGALKLDTNGEVLSEFSSFVKPNVHPTLSDFCTQLTSITQVDVNQADPYPIVIDDFLDWIGVYDDEDYLLCSWGNFDQKILKKNCKLHDLDYDWTEEYINLKFQYPRIKGIRREIGLKRAVENEGFDFEGAHHRAISDALNLAKIFVKYLNLWSR